METWVIIVIIWGAVTVLVLLCSLQSALCRRVCKSHRRAENEARALVASEARRERRQQNVKRDRPVPPPYERVARPDERPIPLVNRQTGRRNSFRDSFHNSAPADGDYDAGVDHLSGPSRPPLPPPAARLPPPYASHQPDERPPLYEPRVPQRRSQGGPASYFPEAAAVRNHDWAARQDALARDRFWRAMDQAPISSGWTRDGELYPWRSDPRRERARDVEMGSSWFLPREQRLRSRL